MLLESHRNSFVVISPFLKPAEIDALLLKEQLAKMSVARYTNTDPKLAENLNPVRNYAVRHEPGFCINLNN